MTTVKAIQSGVFSLRNGRFQRKFVELEHDESTVRFGWPNNMRTAGQVILQRSLLEYWLQELVVHHATSTGLRVLLSRLLFGLLRFFLGCLFSLLFLGLLLFRCFLSAAGFHEFFFDPT